MAFIAAMVPNSHKRPPVLSRSGAVCRRVRRRRLGCGLNVYYRHAADVQRYAVRYEVPTVAAADWEAGDWKRLPVYRPDLTGETEEPLTVQWVGSLQNLEEELLREGWRRPSSKSGSIARCRCSRSPERSRTWMCRDRSWQAQLRPDGSPRADTRASGGTGGSSSLRMLTAIKCRFGTLTGFQSSVLDGLPHHETPVSVQSNWGIGANSYNRIM
jgi:hypothetical protein